MYWPLAAPSRRGASPDVRCACSTSPPVAATCRSRSPGAAIRSGLEHRHRRLRQEPRRGPLRQPSKRPLAALSVRFFTLDALSEEIPSGFDVIVSSLFLHHLDELEAVGLLERMACAASESSS